MSVIAESPEVFWLETMKFGEGFTNIDYYVVTIGNMVVRLLFLFQATIDIALSLAHQVWTSIEAADTIIGIIGTKVTA